MTLKFIDVKILNAILKNIYDPFDKRYSFKYTVNIFGHVIL